MAESGSLYEGLGLEDGEVKDGSPAECNLVIPDSEKELEELVAKRAGNSEDRYKILEARDRILRLRNPKVKVRVEFAVRLTGSCPDMCPEKERYMREFQRRLAIYECLPGPGREPEVDHQTAVKEYSRSSADQEEPLSHDLRPTSTLHLTFNYLLHYVISRIETETENLGDWYYFVWDRTRSLRKDMTQQQLCDLGAVSLMEKCTRFHIYCSSRLCEMDRHAFDPKLNDENLMKCLQSLEHMYTDLHLKGVECPNEPEFRAYQILMNLNEGDILWETQQRPVRVLQAPAVVMALKIHMAVYDKNFVSFFRLLSEVPYMTACLLHRYFFQIRANAIRSLIKAHTVPQKSKITMPMASTKRFLGYENQSNQTFIYFCGSHGITCDILTDSIVVNKRELRYPETPIITREFQLIESKLKVSVIEAINGAPMDPFPTYVPHSSFDEKGYLKAELLGEIMSMKKPVPLKIVPLIPQQLTFPTRNRRETRSPIPLPPVPALPLAVRIRPPHVVDKTEGSGKVYTATGRLFTSSIANVLGRDRPSKENSGLGSRLSVGSTKETVKQRLSTMKADIPRLQSKNGSNPESEDLASLFGSKSKATPVFPSKFGHGTSTSNIFGNPGITPISDSSTSSFGVPIPIESKQGSGFPASTNSVFGIKQETDVPDANVFPPPAYKSSVGGFPFKIKEEPIESSTSIFGVPSDSSAKTGNIFTSPFKGTAGSSNIFGKTNQGFGLTPSPAVGSIFSIPQFGAPGFQNPKVEVTGPDKGKVAAVVIHQTETQVVAEVLTEELREVCQDSLKAAFREKEEQIQRQQLAALRQVITIETFKKIESQIIQKLVAEVSAKEIKQMELYQWLSIQIGGDLFCGVAKEVLTQVATDAHNKAVKEFEDRIKKFREALRRLRLRNMFLEWKRNAAELRVERENRLERQRQNLENFPPIVTFQLSPATILGSWFGLKSPVVNVKKLSLESPALEFLERSVKLSKSFARKLEESTPSVLSYLTANLITMLEKEENLRESSLSPQFLPPVVFNVVVWSEFGSLDRLANWLWSSLSKGCVATQDEDVLAHAFHLRTGAHFVTFQKCTLPIPVSSSDTSALILFCRTEQTNLKLISQVVKKPRPILIFNTSKMSEAQIRRSVNNRGADDFLDDLCILHAEESRIIDDIPVLVEGLTWLSKSLPRPPPLTFPPLNHFVSTLFESYFPMSAKRVHCPHILFQEHNNLVHSVPKLISSTETNWPGKSTRLVADLFGFELPSMHYCKFPDSMLSLLWLEPPAELLFHFHETEDLDEALYQDLMKAYARSLYIPGTPSVPFMSRVNDFLTRPWKGLHSVPWQTFLLTCQRYKVECLETLLPSALDPVCVDLRELKTLESPLRNTFCQSCSSLFNRKRTRPSDAKCMELTTPNKTFRRSESNVSTNSLLQEINDLMRQVRNEKSLSQAEEQLTQSYSMTYGNAD